MPLLIPMLILALGALAVLLLSAWPQIRGLCFIAAGAGALALAALLRLRLFLPVTWVASPWRPLALFAVPLSMEADASGWGMAAALVGSSLLALIGCCASASRPAPVNLALILATTGAGIAALFSSSFVALVVAWAATDVLIAAAMFHYGQQAIRRAGLALLSGILATSALWAATLLAHSEGTTGFLDLARFSGNSASLLQIAVILRLGLVPLHLWRPIDVHTEPAQLIPLVVIPTLLGFDLLTYLPALTAGLPDVLFGLAALTVLTGGFVAWSESEERASMAGVMAAETGLAVLAVANGGPRAVAVAVASATAWALSITIFSLTPGWSGRHFWRGIPSLIALLSLLGLPATLGFTARLTAYSGLEADLLALVVALVGETFVIATLCRLWVWAEVRVLPIRRWLEALYLVLFGGAAVALVWTGLSPQAFAGRGQDAALPKLDVFINQGGVAGWAGWALPLIAGVTLFLAGEGLRQKLESGWRGIAALLRLEWVYGLFYIPMRWMVRLMRGVSSVVEGEGALLWTVFILLIVLLYLTSSVTGPVG